MTNPPLKKGTSYENEILDLLAEIWPCADRAKAGNPSSDIVGTPITVECKNCKTWSLPAWIRKIRAVGNAQWAIFMSPGDRRIKNNPGDVAVFPREFALELLDVWNDVQIGALMVDPSFDLINIDDAEYGGEA